MGDILWNVSLLSATRMQSAQCVGYGCHYDGYKCKSRNVSSSSKHARHPLLQLLPATPHCAAGVQQLRFHLACSPISSLP